VFVSHLAIHFAVGGHEVIYLDLENDRKDVVQRLFTIFLSTYWGKKAPTIGQLYEAPEKWLDNDEVTMAYVENVGERLWVIDAGYEKKILPAHLDELLKDRWDAVKQDDKQVILIVDSINEINSLWPLGKGEYESIQRWLAEIKHLKAKYDAPIILVAHVTQDGVGFKGTSGLKHFARTQIGLERPDATKNVITLSVIRSQFGETGDTRLYLDRTRLLLLENVVTVP
jgi:KaiC/GvpD/RAD55 family RecA-like ATPase